MAFFSHLRLAAKAAIQLGPSQVALFGLYQLGLRSNHFYRSEKRIKDTNHQLSSLTFEHLFELPNQQEITAVIGQHGMQELITAADEVVAGKVRLFGGDPVDLKLTIDQPPAHWTAYESNEQILRSILPDPPDIKMIWEPARFGWAFTLGRAYFLTGDQRYSQVFWQFTDQFLEGNPPYFGPNWMSGQEVAIRLMALVWAAQIFSDSPHSTPERSTRLATSVAQHAARIPSTLLYARSQNNNHLLTEAVGLLTAGLALPSHTASERWRTLGWKWLNRGLQRQIDAYGEYNQHSTNYQRLMLQVALWVKAVEKKSGSNLPVKTRERLNAATHWMLALLDPVSGCVPNLGANDGAYLFPLTICPFEDHRPVVQAAGRAFASYEIAPGPWDEMCLWFGIPLEDKSYIRPERYLGDQLYAKESWAYLRTAQFRSRPSHADQLHLDLWWRGMNIACDAGTYSYNTPSPWDNSLTHALVHNTITIGESDHFSRVGKFLYLDWFDAYRRDHLEVDEHALHSISGRHYGFKKWRVSHERRVTAYMDGSWKVTDELQRLPSLLRSKWLDFRLHWLLPDWRWEIEESATGGEIRLESPAGWMMLQVDGQTAAAAQQVSLSLVRAGVIVHGSGEVSPVRGWTSPTYGVKQPALSLALSVKTNKAVKFFSRFNLPKS